MSNGDAGLVVVDNSILSATARCETYAFVRYACGLNTRGESLALSAGSAIHVGAAAWLSGLKPGKALGLMATTYEESVERFLKVAELDEIPAEDARFAPEWVEAIFAQYLEGNTDAWPFKMLARTAEKPIAAPFGELADGRPVRYVARLDAIVRKWSEGDAWSLDWKTTRKASDWWIEKQKVSSQFSGQLWLGQQEEVAGTLRYLQASGRDATSPISLAGVVLNVIEIPEKHKSDRKCPEHHVSYQECSIRHAGTHIVYITRHAEELRAWEQSAHRLVVRYARLLDRAREEGIEGVKSVSMQGRFNEGCVFCSQKEWCRLGRNVRPAAVKATFVSDRWDPERRQEG
jgi:hypothetical protein